MVFIDDVLQGKQNDDDPFYLLVRNVWMSSNAVKIYP
jgi:hypothetical protein